MNITKNLPYRGLKDIIKRPSTGEADGLGTFKEQRPGEKPLFKPLIKIFLGYD